MRSHWAIQATHRLLDVIFREDDGRTREQHAGNNLVVVRRVAVSLLKHVASRVSSKVKRFQAALDPNYLLRALRGFPAVSMRWPSHHTYPLAF